MKSTLDHNALKNDIMISGSYRKLLELRRTVQALKGSFPFTVFSDLQGRVEERIKTFEYPVCEDNGIKVVFSNGLSVPVEDKDCHDARESDQKFTDFIFSKYVSAKDLSMEPGKLSGSYDKDYFRRVSRNLSPQKDLNIELSSSIQTKVDLLMTKIDNLERVYNLHVPKILENLDSLNKKMDTIYKKMMENENSGK